MIKPCNFLFSNIGQKSNKKVQLGFWTIFSSLLVFLAFNLNSKNGSNRYKDVIWADAAGYYIYLPATFIYNWDQNQLPENFPDRLGNGFQYTEDGKLKTKYPVGVALLESPFFFIGHAVAKVTEYPADGASTPYHTLLTISGIFYLLIGIFYLQKYLRTRFELKTVFITLLIMLAGTNLYYYGLNAAGMSHIYSFACFSVLLWLAHCIVKSQRSKHIIAFAVVASLSVLIRPTAVFYLLFLAWMHSDLLKIYWSFVKKKLPFAILTLLLVVLVWIPQLAYWKYLSGNWIHYSYTNEGFTNILSPELVHFWFSTKNGLFIYAPVLIFALIGMVIAMKGNRRESLQQLTLFIVMSYIFSSWWCWWYGCSYGSRSFVEFIVPMTIPFCFFVRQTFLTKRTSLSWIAFALIGIFIFINLKIIYKYDDCFYGGVWDWEAYYKLIF